MSPHNSPDGEWKVVIPQAMVDRILKSHAHEGEPELPKKGSLLDQDIPLFDEQEPPRKLGPFLLVGAIVAMMLIFTGLQVADSHAPATENEASVTSGVQSMSAAELIQSVNSGKGTAYWLGPKSGDVYTNSTAIDGVDQVAYHPESSPVTSQDQFDVSVSTFRNLATYNVRPHQFFGDNAITVTLKNGAAVTYNKSLPNQAIVIFPGKPQVIVLDYQAVQAVPRILDDAQNLVLIS